MLEVHDIEFQMCVDVVAAFLPYYYFLDKHLMSRFNLFTLIALLLTVALGGFFLSNSHKKQDFTQGNDRALPVQTESAEKLATTEKNIGQAQQAKQALDLSISAAQQQTTALDSAVSNSQKYQQEMLNNGKRVARLTQGLAVASAIKTPMMAYFMEHNQWPQSNQIAGAPPAESFNRPPHGSPVIQSGNVLPDGKIVIQFAQENGVTEHLWLQATGSEPNEIRWQCSSPDISDIGSIISQCKYQKN